MAHMHVSSKHAPWLHHLLLRLNGLFPILTLRLYKWGAEASLLPVIGWPVRRFVRWYARHMEKAQVVTFAEVQRLVREAQSCSIGDCPCLHVFEDHCGHTREKCVRLNTAHDVAVRLDGDRHRSIAKEELLPRLRSLSQEHGLHHTVVFLGGPVVYAVCTCCERCIAYQMVARYGQPEALLKGRYICRVNPHLCARCGTCTPACKFGAMRHGRVDARRCYGCGLCAARCPRGAPSMCLRDDGAQPAA